MYATVFTWLSNTSITKTQNVYYKTTMGKLSGEQSFCFDSWFKVITYNVVNLLVTNENNEFLQDCFSTYCHQSQEVVLLFLVISCLVLSLASLSAESKENIKLYKVQELLLLI